MSEETILKDYLTLAFTPHLGAVSLYRLLQEFKSPGEILKQPLANLKPYLHKAQLAAPFWQDDKIQQQYVIPALTWLNDTADGEILTLIDERYPLELTEVYPPPPVLFARGRLALLTQPKISIVGSRDATPQGMQIATQTAAELSRQGFCIVSGLALGVDRAAHSGALTGKGSTIAVIGTGIDLIYPKSNYNLARTIAEQGLLLSEFPLGTKAVAGNFPVRNRLIAGLSLATVVVEASLRSGSLITARLAGEFGKEVMAFPGSVFSRQSKGAHKLIKEGAKLVENAAEIVEDFAKFAYNEENTENNTIPEKIYPSPTKLILDTMGSQILHADEITAKIDLDLKEVQRILINLELDGVIVRTAGGRFQRVIF